MYQHPWTKASHSKVYCGRRCIEACISVSLQAESNGDKPIPILPSWPLGLDLGGALRTGKSPSPIFGPISGLIDGG